MLVEAERPICLKCPLLESLTVAGPSSLEEIHVLYFMLVWIDLSWGFILGRHHCGLTAPSSPLLALEDGLHCSDSCLSMSLSSCWCLKKALWFAAAVAMVYLEWASFRKTSLEGGVIEKKKMPTVSQGVWVEEKAGRSWCQWGETTASKRRNKSCWLHCDVRVLEALLPTQMLQVLASIRLEVSHL